MEDRGLQEHLEGMVEQNQNSIDAAAIPWPVEMFDAEHERVNRLPEQERGFSLHGATVYFIDIPLGPEKKKTRQD